MLTVRMIKKFHDKNGKLVGYTLRNENNPTEVMNVTKEQLKAAIMNGQCEVVNMTLTSDGRLLGSASNKPKINVMTQEQHAQLHLEQKQRAIAKLEEQRRQEEAQRRAEEERRRQLEAQLAHCSEELLEVYTNGKHIVAALVDQTELDKEAFGLTEITGLKPGLTFDIGHEATRKITDCDYNNISLINGKPDISKVKRKSFKSVKAKLLKIVAENYGKFTLEVSKTDKKYEYAIKINEYAELLNANKMIIIQIIYCLIEDAMITSKFKCEYIDGDTMYIRSLNTIKDVRAAVRLVTKIEK